jgi:hypothetical protein
MAKNMFRPVPGEAILYTLKGIALLAGVLFIFSCDLPQGMGKGESSLTIVLPGGNKNNGNMARSVLSNDFTAALRYQITLTGPGGTIDRTVEGGSVTVSLQAGEWAVTVKAYDSSDTLVGLGSETTAVAPGQPASIIVKMNMDPGYEAGLTDIYIHNEAELRRIGTDFIGRSNTITFHLENNITLTQPWAPIGSPPLYEGGIFQPTAFAGKFDGGGHTITVTSFSGESLTSNCLGFFGYTEGGEIKNLNLKYELGSPVISANTEELFAGGLVGRAMNTDIENIAVTFGGSYGFSVSIAVIDTDYHEYANSRIGGLVGYLDSGDISRCHVRGKVKGESATANWICIGGIAAEVSGDGDTGSIIGESSFTGMVYGSCVNSTDSRANVDAGGIVGDSSRLTINSCYVAGQVKAEGYINIYAGGIHGWDDLEGSDMYIYADVSATGLDSTKGRAYAGGLAGSTSYYNDGFSNAYVAGKVSARGSADNKAGGMVGDIRINSGNPIAIDNCMALLTALDGGNSPAVYTIGFKDNPSGNASGSNGKVWDAISITRGGITYTRDGPTYFLSSLPSDSQDLAPFDSAAGFAGSTNQSTYTGAGWDFTAGTGDWKFISGYDFPVLSWQTLPPDLSHVPDSFSITWP